MSEFSIDFILNRAGERYLGTNASMGVLERIKLHGAYHHYHHHPPTTQSQKNSSSHSQQQQQPPQQQQQHNDDDLNCAANAIRQSEQFLLMNQHDSDFADQKLSLPSVAAPMFDWLQYTRYHPPKLPRSFRAGGISKRTPGRLPRIPFTQAQLEALEKSYQQSNYLSAEDANKLAESLDLTSTRVKIWYQNRRARERRERREKEDECYDSTVSSNASTPPASPSSDNPKKSIKPDLDLTL